MDRKEQIEARFGVAAEAYAKSEHASGRDLERMLELADLCGNEKVLDIATGSGHTAIAFAPHVASVVATDMAEGMLAKTRERAPANVEVRFADAESLPFEDESFDIVTCRIAPHHFLDIQAATIEVARVLKPGGRYVLVDSLAPESPVAAAFLHDVESRRDPTHVLSLTESGWRSACSNARLEVLHSEPIRKPHDFEAWLDRGGCGHETKEQLRSAFAEAPPEARDALKIRVEAGRVTFFADEKLLLVARKV